MPDFLPADPPVVPLATVWRAANLWDRTPLPGWFRPIGYRPLPPAVLLMLVGGCDPTGPGGAGQEDYPTPVEVAAGMRFTEVGAGWFHTCATAEGGTVHCWGKSEVGELGGPAPTTICESVMHGDVPCTGTPQRVIDSPPLVAISGSTHHTCGLDAGGVAWCWGLQGFLGDGVPHRTPNRGPVPCVAPTGSGLTCRAEAARVSGDARFRSLHVSIEGGGTCGTATDGRAMCWGLSGPASMGIGANLVPTALPTALRFETMLVQGLFGCGLAQGAAWCWGSNWYGAVGNASSDQGVVPAPVPVVGGHGYTGLAATLSSVCGLRVDGSAVCWGHLPTLEGVQQRYRYGSTPVRAEGPAFVEVVGGGNHHCGLTAGGDAWCWGANSSGFLGDGGRGDREVPVRVLAPAGVQFRSLAAGGVHTCGLATDGRLFCWGHNGFGQVGRPPAWARRR
jgi:hypothetical protein